MSSMVWCEAYLIGKQILKSVEIFLYSPYSKAINPLVSTSFRYAPLLIKSIATFEWLYFTAYKNLTLKKTLNNDVHPI
jgi:hypothetical protein